MSITRLKMSQIFSVHHLVLLALFVTLGTSCSSTDQKADTAEKAFAQAQEFDKAERYEESLKRYQEVRSKFPYSRFASESALAIADVYFKQESFAEAQLAYQNFRDLHPKHPRLYYVIFRIGLSYFNQVPSTIDRDLTLAPSAISVFEEFLQLFPNSELAPQAIEKKNAATKMLAEKEIYIADFYFKLKYWESALGRYESVLSRHKGQGFEEKALSRAAVAAHRAGDLDKFKKYKREIESSMPNSEGLNFVNKEVQ